MRVCQLPGTGQVTQKYPNFAEYGLLRAAQVCATLALHPSRYSHIIEQGVITAQLMEGISGLALEGDTSIVQIGANDGKFDDPIRGILETRTARAILVEPMPTPFAELSKLHAERPRTQLVNAAMSRNGGPIELYVPKVTDRELHSSVWACATPEQAAREVKKNMGRRALKDTVIDTVPIMSYSAAELLTMCALSPSDVAVLICDAEGQDPPIITSFLEAGAKPDIIFFEQLHAPAVEAAKLKTDLGDRGYQMTETAKDVLAIAPPFL